MVYWQLFLAFFRVGIFGYGGGPSMIPLVHTECVQKYKWVSSDEFADNFAFANTLPGPIATKMAAYIGYKIKGWLGALVAIIAVTLPIVIMMIFLLQFVSSMKDIGPVNGMIQAIQPVIGVMMLVLTWEFLAQGWKGTKRKGGFILLVLISLGTLQYLNLHPGILIAVFLITAFLYTTWVTKRQRGEQEAGRS